VEVQPFILSYGILSSFAFIHATIQMVASPHRDEQARNPDAGSTRFYEALGLHNIAGFAEDPSRWGPGVYPGSAVLF